MNISRRDRIAVFGLYKTGTTALYSNIRQALPHSPRTLFEADRYVALAGDRERGVLAKVIIGLDNADYDSFSDFDKKVLLVRDPRDWIISGCLFLTQTLPGIYRNQTRASEILSLLEKKERNPGDIPFTTVLSEVASSSRLESLDGFLQWIPTALDEFRHFENRMQPGLRIRYEDYVVRNLSVLERYLGFAIPDRFRLDSEFSHVARTRSHGAWRSWFTPEDIAILRPILSRFLDQYGYEADWYLDEHPRIVPEHSSRYVERIVQRRRALEGLQERFQ